MDVPDRHLAQANVARALAPLDDPAMADFVAQLEHVNAVADRSPGFVWRLQTEDGDATQIRAFDDPRVIFNMSVWESVEALHDYVYRSEHRAPLKSRRLWFERPTEAHFVMWWIAAGNVPTVVEARAKLELLRRNGPAPDAFTFQKVFGPDGLPAGRPRSDWTLGEAR